MQSSGIKRSLPPESDGAELDSPVVEENHCSFCGRECTRAERSRPSWHCCDRAVKTNEADFAAAGHLAVSGLQTVLQHLVSADDEDVAQFCTYVDPADAMRLRHTSSTLLRGIGPGCVVQVSTRRFLTAWLNARRMDVVLPRPPPHFPSEVEEHLELAGYPAPQCKMTTAALCGALRQAHALDKFMWEVQSVRGAAQGLAECRILGAKFERGGDARPPVVAGSYAAHCLATELLGNAPAWRPGDIDVFCHGEEQYTRVLGLARRGVTSGFSPVTRSRRHSEDASVSVLVEVAQPVSLVSPRQVTTSHDGYHEPDEPDDVNESTTNLEVVTLGADFLFLREAAWDELAVERVRVGIPAWTIEHPPSPRSRVRVWERLAIGPWPFGAAPTGPYGNEDARVEFCSTVVTSRRIRELNQLFKRHAEQHFGAHPGTLRRTQAHGGRGRDRIARRCPSYDQWADVGLRRWHGVDVPWDGWESHMSGWGTTSSTCHEGVIQDEAVGLLDVGNPVARAESIAAGMDAAFDVRADRIKTDVAAVREHRVLCPCRLHHPGSGYGSVRPSLSVYEAVAKHEDVPDFVPLLGNVPSTCTYRVIRSAKVTIKSADAPWGVRNQSLHVCYTVNVVLIASSSLGNSDTSPGTCVVASPDSSCPNEIDTSGHVRLADGTHRCHDWVSTRSLLLSFDMVQCCVAMSVDKWLRRHYMCPDETRRCLVERRIAFMPCFGQGAVRDLSHAPNAQRLVLDRVLKRVDHYLSKGFSLGGIDSRRRPGWGSVPDAAARPCLPSSNLRDHLCVWRDIRCATEWSRHVGAGYRAVRFAMVSRSDAEVRWRLRPDGLTLTSPFVVTPLLLTARMPYGDSSLLSPRIGAALVTRSSLHQRPVRVTMLMSWRMTSPFELAFFATPPLHLPRVEEVPTVLALEDGVAVAQVEHRAGSTVWFHVATRTWRSTLE